MKGESELEGESYEVMFVALMRRPEPRGAMNSVSSVDPCNFNRGQSYQCRIPNWISRKWGIGLICTVPASLF